MLHFPRFGRHLAASVALACCLAASAAQAKPVATNRLLPKHTLAYVRITDVSQLVEKFQQTSTGRMLQDPKMKPVVENVYGAVQSATAQLKDELGVSLDDLTRLPRGEITFAVIAGDKGPPVLVLLAHVGDEIATARKLIERAEAELEKAGGQRSVEVVGDTKLVLYEFPGDGPRAGQFEKDGTIVLASSQGVARQLLKDWTRGAEESLSENQQFAAIMRACRGSRDEPPQISWFVDPIGLVREAMQSNASAQAALALLPVLGLDGFKGLGGSFIMAEGDFDVISHLHVLLDDPRSGVLDLIALEAGDSAPPRWVPGDVASYTTFHWNFQATYDRLAKLIDSFQGQGFTAQRVKDAGERFVGVDVAGEVLPMLDGRVTIIGWVGRPATTGGAASLFALHLKDSAAAEEVLQKLVVRYADAFEKKSYGGVNYQAIKMPARQPEQPQPFGTPAPCVAVLEDCLMFSDNVRLLEHVIVSKEDTSQSLAGALDFKLIASKIGRQAGGAKPALLRFERPEEGLRFLYEFANSDAARSGLKAGGENNKFLKALSQSMEDRPLPPFAVIAKYFAPGGGMAVDDETGIHLVSFTLRRE